jgi:uncharacterized protein YycO
MRITNECLGRKTCFSRSKGCANSTQSRQISTNQPGAIREAKSGNVTTHYLHYDGSFGADVMVTAVQKGVRLASYRPSKTGAMVGTMLKGN